MHYHSYTNEFRAITARLGSIQIAQASRFSNAELTTLICTCRIGEAWTTGICARPATNDNHLRTDHYRPRPSQAMIYTLQCVAQMNASHE